MVPTFIFNMMKAVRDGKSITLTKGDFIVDVTGEPEDSKPEI